MPEYLTTDELAKLKELEAMSSVGPWEVRRGGNFTDFGSLGFVAFCEENHHSSTPLRVGSANWQFPWGEDSNQQPEADADFIATTRNHLPALIAEVEAKRKKVALVETDYFESEGYVWVSHGDCSQFVFVSGQPAVFCPQCGMEIEWK